MTEKSKRPQKLASTSAWEWVVAAVGAALVTASIGYLVWYGVTHPEGVPRLELRQLDTAVAAKGYLVKILITNSGNATAAAVHVEGRLMKDGTVVETGEATVEYVPQHSQREAYLQFYAKPADFKLDLQVKGMAAP